MATKPFDYEFEIPLPRAAVFNALLDPDILAKCIDGCEQLVIDSDDRYRFKVSFGFGPLKRSVKGTVMLTELDPPNSFEFRRGSYIPFTGPGAFSGEVQLTDSGSGTRVHISGEMEAGTFLSTLAQYFTPKKVEALSSETVATFSEAAARKYG